MDGWLLQSVDGLTDIEPTMIHSGIGFVSLDCSPNSLTEFTALIMC